MSILIAGLLALGAIAAGVAASVLVGVIVLTNFFGVNYEAAGRQVFLGAAALILIVLSWSALTGAAAVATASYWILGISGVVIAGWLLQIVVRR